MNDPVENLPAVMEKGLPVATTYEAARTAIAKCEQIDDCATWADKAASLACYARQAKDDCLAVMARRIQARAVRRAGELFKLIAPQPGKRTDIEPSGVAPTTLQVAAAAGMSKDQMVQSLRVAYVSSDDFDAKVESATPPTITQLAEAGTKKLPRSKPNDAREVANATGTIRAFAAFCERNDPRWMLPALSPSARFDLRRNFSTIKQWLNRFDDTNGPVLQPEDVFGSDSEYWDTSAAEGTSEKSNGNCGAYKRASRGG